MNKLLVVLVLVLVLGGGYVLVNGKTTAPPVVPSESVSPTAMMEKEGVVEFTLDSFEFGYDQKTVTVKKGDTVKITLTNSGKMMHDFVVDEFIGAKTKQIKNGETDTVTFVADKAGTFEFYCSVGKHRAQGMVGKLIVE